MMGRWSAVGIAGVLAFALGGCGGNSTPPLPTVTLPPSNGGGSPPPSFNPAAVQIAEVPVPQPSPAENGPVFPSVIDVGNDGAVYFGQLNSSLAAFGNFGVFRYSGGAFTQTLPVPEPNYFDGGVDAIDAHDSSTVMWTSSYQRMDEPVSFGDMMECGANGGTAALCTFPIFGGFITSIVTAKDGTIWTAGSQCCGSGAGGYPAQLPVILPPDAFSLDLSNGPGAKVWGVLQPFGPLYEFAANGAIQNTYQLPPGSNLVGNHVLIQGADGALWFTDAGNNAIDRFAASGQFSQFRIPTPNSGVRSITLAADGGMWFTEATAGKVGRIDASGKMYEFSVPTPGAQPTEIAAVPAACACKTSQVWFVETTANRIASVSY